MNELLNSNGLGHVCASFEGKHTFFVAKIMMINYGSFYNLQITFPYIFPSHSKSWIEVAIRNLEELVSFLSNPSQFQVLVPNLLDWIKICSLCKTQVSIQLECSYLY